MKEHYECYSFSLSLPAGEGQNNIANLLNHLAKTLKHDYPGIEIQDIVFSNDEIDDNNIELPNFTIYYRLPKEK